MHSNVADWYVQSVNPEMVTASWNVMAHAQKPDFVFRRNRRVHLNRWGRQFSRLLAVEVCASAVVMVAMLDTPCSEVVWRVLATHSIRQFPLHFPSRASPCAITFQLDCTLRTVARFTSSLQCSQMFRTSLRSYSFSLSRGFSLVQFLLSVSTWGSTLFLDYLLLTSLYCSSFQLFIFLSCLIVTG
jgi:hypothetical protein